MLDTSDLTTVLAAAVDRLAANDAVATQVRAVFGGDVGVAAAWFGAALDQHAADIARIAASAAAASASGEPDLRALLGNLLRDVPNAATLSPAELKNLLLDVLAERRPTRTEQ